MHSRTITNTLQMFDTYFLTTPNYATLTALPLLSLEAGAGIAVHSAKQGWDRASSFNRDHKITAKMGTAAHKMAATAGKAHGAFLSIYK
mgnify:CR=1 FL=1